MTSKIEVTIEEAQVGQRLDKLLTTYCKGLSRNHVQKLIASNHLTANDRILTDCSYQVKLYDHLSISVDVREEECCDKPVLIGKNIPLDVVYEDEHLLVINKQSGLTVHGGAGTQDDTLVNALVFYLGDKLSSVGGDDRPGIVHRLDRDTSGLMLVAKNDICHAKLGDMLQKRLIKREYVALVYGMVYPIMGKIETYIARNAAQRTAMRVVRDSGKLALTHYKVEEVLVGGVVSKVVCWLETGRTHQIRVHMLHKKNPLIGDQVYGRSLNHNLKSLSEKQRQMVLSFPRQALHARKIGFIHPMTGEEMEFSAEMPIDMMDLYQTLLGSGA